MASASKSLRKARFFNSSAASFHPAVFLLLVEVRLGIGRAMHFSAAGSGTHGRSACGVGLDLAVLPILALVVGLGPQVDLILIAVIAKKQNLRSVCDKDQSAVGKGHEIPPDIRFINERKRTHRRSALCPSAGRPEATCRRAPGPLAVRARFRQRRHLLRALSRHPRQARSRLPRSRRFSRRRRHARCSPP